MVGGKCQQIFIAAIFVFHMMKTIILVAAVEESYTSRFLREIL